MSHKKRLQLDREIGRIIENFALWEGRINTRHLIDMLSIGRQKASELLGEYQALYPKNLEYDASLKGYKTTADFQAHFSSGHIDDYGQMLQRCESPTYLSLFETGFCHIEAPLRNISPALVQPIIRAIKEQLRLDIGYTSLSSPAYESRIISPHCLVFDGIRWHTRAWCEKNQDYRDFVLSRFNGDYEFEGPASKTGAQDTRWHTWLELVIQPDPRLSKENQRLLELDYQMESGQRSLSVRAALVMYVIKRLRLDYYDTTPEAQQIILTPECAQAIKPYLP